MKENKKGMVTPNNHAQGSNINTPYDYKSYLNMIEIVCLLLFIASIALMYIGAYIGKNELTILGLGLGGAAGLIQVGINIRED